jgi:dTDP-4-dehydrorhamnose 3,5-epimerase
MSGPTGAIPTPMYRTRADCRQMQWSFEKAALAGVFVVTPPVFADERGFFQETYSERLFRENGIPDHFVQANHSWSKHAGTLRGIHFQTEPEAQAKLVRCIRGRIFDVAVDLRRSSPTFGNWFATELSPDNRRQLYMPVGFGHAFLTLEDDSEVLYSVSRHYSRPHDAAVRWNDPEIAIDWPVRVADVILSQKDADAPLLRDAPVLFD